LNTIFERTEGHLVAFIEIAFSPSSPAAWSALGPRNSAPDVYKQTLSSGLLSIGHRQLDRRLTAVEQFAGVGAALVGD
jgi:hypothetical protein